MINCEKAQMLFSLYLDNELDETEKSEFEKHLEICSSCRSELLKLQQVISLVAGIGDEDLPQGFGESLHNKLVPVSEETKKNAGVNVLRNKYVKIFSTLAAGLLVVVLLKDFYTGGLLNRTGAKSSTAPMNGAQANRQEMEKGTASAGTAMDIYDRYGNFRADGAVDQTLGTDQRKTDGAAGENVSGGAVADQMGEKPSPPTAKDELYGNNLKEVPKEAVPGASANPGDSFVPEIKMQENATFSLIVPDTTVSTTAESREKGKIKSEQIIKSTSILLAVDKPDVALNQTQIAAAFYGATTDKAKASSAMSAFAAQESTQTVLLLQIPEDRFQQFTDQLKYTYGATNISVSPVRALNAEEKTLPIIQKLEEVNQKIEQLQKQGYYDKQVMEELRVQKENLQNEIDHITQQTGTISITITFMRK